VPNKLKMTLSSHGRPPLTSQPCSKTDSLFVKAVEGMELDNRLIDFYLPMDLT
jgi:hypothetical protein